MGRPRCRNNDPASLLTHPNDHEWPSQSPFISFGSGGASCACAGSWAGEADDHVAACPNGDTSVTGGNGSRRYAPARWLGSPPSWALAHKCLGPTSRSAPERCSGLPAFGQGGSLSWYRCQRRAVSLSEGQAGRVAQLGEGSRSLRRWGRQGDGEGPSLPVQRRHCNGPAPAGDPPAHQRLPAAP